MMTITQLLAAGPAAHLVQDRAALKVHCLRLMELTQRTSAVMKVSERHFDRLDPVINVFRTFGSLNDVLVTAKMAIVPDNSFAETVHSEIQRAKTEMVVLPWTSQTLQFTSGPTSIPQDEFIKVVLERVEGHCAIMIDSNLYLDDESPSEPSLSRSISMRSLRTRTVSPSSGEIEPMPIVLEGYHIFLPYFGGKDDRVALSMVIQLLNCKEVKATIVRIRNGTADESDISIPATAHVDDKSPSVIKAVSDKVSKMVRFPVTHSENAYEDVTEEDIETTNLLNSLPEELRPRVMVENVSSCTPLQYAVKRAKLNIDSNHTTHHLIVVGRGVRSARTAEMTALMRKDLRDLLRGGPNSEMAGKSCLGEVGEGIVLSHVTGGLLIVQGGVEDE